MIRDTIAIAVLIAAGYASPARGQSTASAPTGEFRAANWTNIGPEGGGFLQLAFDPHNPDTIYGAASVGLFKSIDQGASWNNAGLNGFFVSGFSIDPQEPNTLYAVAGINVPGAVPPGHMFKSIDGGTSWNVSDEGLPCCVMPGSLAIDPFNTRTLFAFVYNFLFKSTDGGANWSLTYQPPDDREFYDITFDPKTPGTIYAASMGPDDVQNAVFKSVDGGTSWSEPTHGFDTVGGLTLDPSNPATLYTVTGSGLYKSTDGAASWHALNGLPIQSFGMQGLGFSGNVIVDARNANTLYVPFNNPFTGQGGLLKSTDAGASWRASGHIPGLIGGNKTIAIDPGNSSILYAATSSGVYRSADGGASFSPYAQPRAVPVTSVVPDLLHAGTILAGGAGASIFRSTDAGRSWVETATNLKYDSVAALAISPQNANTWYAGTGSPYCGSGTSAGIFKSVNGGTSWIDTQSGIGCLSAIVIDPQTPGTVYAGSRFNGGVNKSIDGGRTWNIMSSGIGPPAPPDTNSGPRVTALAIDPQNTGTLFAAADGAFKSIDGGANWAGINSGFPSYSFPSVTALAVDPDTPSTVYAATAPQYGSGGIWKTIDGGANWRNVLIGSVYALAIDPRKPATIYAGANDGLERSTDGGRTWRKIGGGPGRVTALALNQQDPDMVFAGGPGGLFAIALVLKFQ